MKNFDRVFCFGCSWTKFKWPTWADMCKYATSKPVYNWGLPGLGNVGIFYRMLEADLKHKFTENDLILVQWTSWHRDDIYKTKWECNGLVVNYGEDYLKKYWHWNNDVIKNSSSIISANKMFNISFQFSFLNFPSKSWWPELNPNESYHELYYFYLRNIPKMIIFENENKIYHFDNNCVDDHPDVLSNLLFFKKHIEPMGFDITPKYDQLIDLQNNISNSLNKNQNIVEQHEIIYQLVKKFDSDLFKKIGF
jgi:hypothetical protein